MKWIKQGDIDGFFGLFVDNLLQLLLILTLGPLFCGFSPAFVIGTILPAAAVSIAVGNLFYAWQGWRLARRTGREDVTALPYGINTVSLVAFVFLVMGPVYKDTGDERLAWHAGLFACVLSGVIEVAGAFVGDWLRRVTPRAALLSSLAGVALTFIAMGFIFQIFASPFVALVPVILILAGYGGKLRLPFGLPAGFVAVVIGSAAAWGLYWAGLGAAPHGPALTLGLHLPQPHFRDVAGLFLGDAGWKYLSVILPMGLFNVIGSLQSLESAEAAGDRYETRPSLLANGIGTFAAACFGSPFPTTIYIGHPGWKAMGARTGYSLLNGAIIALMCFFGVVTAVMHVVPLEAMLGILVWIGVIITAQAFQEIPKAHALAVAVGLIPALAAWALLLIKTTLQVAGSSLGAAAPKFGNTLFIDGVIALSQGFILTSMILAALTVFLIERKFLTASLWAFAGAVFSASGLIHAYTLGPAGERNLFGFLAAPSFAAAYALAGLLLAALGWRERRRGRKTRETAGQRVTAIS